MIYKLPLYGKWHVETDETLAAAKAGTPAQKAAADYFEMMYFDHYEKNPLAFFLAHSEAKDYINDRTNKLCILLAGVQVGKTYSLLAKLCLRAVPTHEKWYCYTDGGLVYHKWEGPGRLMMASYQWHHVRTNLWPKLCAIMPVDELREYSPKWKSPMARRKFKTVSEHSPSVKLACGSILDVFCYRSPPDTFTSTTYDRGANLDEQSPLYVVNALFERGQNCSSFQIGVSCTPEQLPGCEWTGSGSWIQRAWDKVDTLGMSIGRYRIDRDLVPDAIIDKEAKAAIFHKHITYPRQIGSMKAIRAGESHYYGRFESSEGLVYDNWVPPIHWITPFPIPPYWTKFRSIDPGGTTAVLFAAMSPWGDCILYDEYYDTSGLGISDSCRRIIAQSGNKRILVSTYAGDNGNTMQQWEERFDGNEFGFSVLDGRTFKQPAGETGVTIGMKWAAEGLRCIPASGKRNIDAIPIVKDWLDIVPGRIHILIRMGKAKEIIAPGGAPLVGAPKLYVFNTLKNFRNEIDSYINKTNKPNDPEDNQTDHAMTALKYLILQGPRYLGPMQFMELAQPTIIQQIEEAEKQKPRQLHEYH